MIYNTDFGISLDGILMKFSGCRECGGMEEVSSLYDKEIIENTILMQYTGLKDKNGKEIYEGDVVILDHWKSQDIFDYSKPFSVTWQDGQIDFRQGLYHNFIGSMNGKIDLRIIGNIYENPELLT